MKFWLVLSMSLGWVSTGYMLRGTVDSAASGVVNSVVSQVKSSIPFIGGWIK